ncbi:G5 domain-containing protein, partial [Streptococcus pyogenes]
MKGEKGYTETVYEIIYTNGVETSRKIIKENHQEPVNEVLLVGMSSLNEYTVSILSYDPEYQPIGRDYIEAPDLPYGETQLKE